MLTILKLSIIDIFACLLGFLTINIWLWKTAKNKYDLKKQKFPYKTYFSSNIDDWAFSFIASFGILAVAPTSINYVLAWYGEQPIEWFPLISYLIGLLATFLVDYFIMKREDLVNKFKKPSGKE